MKTNKIFIVYFAIFLILLIGCANKINNEANKIVVEKQVGETVKYEYFNEITDNEKCQKLIHILDSISWENTRVCMAYPPHYKFHFKNTKQENKSNGLIHDLWISPKKDKVELVVEGESKYVQLNNEKSTELYEIISGKKLSDD